MSTIKPLLFPAFAASVTVPAGIFALASALNQNSLTGWWGIVLPVVLLATLAHAFLLGLPCIVFLQRRGNLRLRSLALAGFLIGAAPSALILMVRAPATVLAEPLSMLFQLLYLGALGMAGGIAFFVVWHLQRRT